MLIIPTAAVPNQTLTVALGGQACSINIYQTINTTGLLLAGGTITTPGLFLDLYVAGALIIGGAVCETVNRIVRDLYLGFIGDLTWLNNVGDGTDPYYTGLGTTYSLAYLSPSDLGGIG